jgi:hypothetical protein
MPDGPPRGGCTHVFTIDQLRAFRAVPAVEKLRWLESMRRFLERSLTPEKLEIMQRFRRGEL